MTENDGSPRKILLSDLGEALIYKDRIVATANDRVKFLEHVHGSFSFGIKSTVTNSTTDATIETNFGTTLEKIRNCPRHFSKSRNEYSTIFLQIRGFTRRL